MYYIDIKKLLLDIQEAFDAALRGLRERFIVNLVGRYCRICRDYLVERGYVGIHDLRQAGGIGAGFSEFILIRHYKRDSFSFLLTINDSATKGMLFRTTSISSG